MFFRLRFRIDEREFAVPSQGLFFFGQSLKNHLYELPRRVGLA